MTLILTAGGSGAVVQVTDRLVSRGTQRFDTSSNKNLLVLGDDGVLTIAYTGLSYVEETPTDQWLTEQLLGKPFPLGRRGNAPALLHHNRRTWYSVGQVIDVIRASFQRANDEIRPPGWGSHPVSVVVAGWIWYRKKRTRPVECGVAIDDERHYRVTWSKRHLGAEELLMSVAPTGYVSREEAQALLAAVRNCEELSGVEGLLVSKVRDVASRYSSVGPDCMCITIPHPGTGPIIVRYRQAASPPAPAVDTGSEEAQPPPAFTPWIVSRSLVNGPVILRGPGPTIHDFGPYDVQIEGSDPGPQGPISSYGGQPRPRRPR